MGGDVSPSRTQTAAHVGALSGSRSRIKAVHARGRILEGADLAAEKHDERATYGDTIGALFALFTQHCARRKSWPELRRIYEHDVLPAWRHRRVQDITRREIRDLVEQKAKTAPIMANRLLARISRLFSFALERDWIEANPAFRMRRPSPETSRDRVLSRSELKELWHVLHETEATDGYGRSLPRRSQTLNDAFVVLLLTAQRGGEVWRMRWEDSDLETVWSTLPAAYTKNADPHRVPLTQPVLDILHRRWKIRDARYVFSNSGRRVWPRVRRKRRRSSAAPRGAVSHSTSARTISDAPRPPTWARPASIDSILHTCSIIEVSPTAP